MQLKTDAADEELLHVIERALHGALEDSEVAELAKIMAGSGQSFPFSRGLSADIASTGGPSSLSTLLCPLFLRALGHTVPKLGVPGRPAGGVDVLAQIPGFQFDLSAPEVDRVIKDCGYAHFVAGPQFTPLDARLFRLRQEHGAQHVPSLVVASLLAKKLAVGIRTVGLDIRVAAHGNFGGDMDAARINAQLFNHIAGMLGVTSTCFLTSADHPYQPYIGRGEAIVAIYRLFSGTSEPWLNRHAGHCAWMASATVGALPRPASSLAYKEVLQANIIAQGGTIDAFRRKAEEVQQGHQLAVRARAPGFPKIDLEQVRKVLVDAQRALTGHGPYPDPAGVIIIAEGTAPVDVGAPILTVRADDWSSGIFDKISSCVTTVPNPPAFVGVAVHG